MVLVTIMCACFLECHSSIKSTLTTEPLPKYLVCITDGNILKADFVVSPGQCIDYLCAPAVKNRFSKPLQFLHCFSYVRMFSSLALQGACWASHWDYTPHFARRPTSCWHLPKGSKVSKLGSIETCCGDWHTPFSVLLQTCSDFELRTPIPQLS